MSRLETHSEKARKYRADAEEVKDPGSRIELWFLSAYHFIEACAARNRIHIQKHQRVPDELRRSPAIFWQDTPRVAEAFRYLDNVARAKFVYGDTGTPEDLDHARTSYETIVAICEEALR